MLLFRKKVPADWLPKVLGNLPAVLVDHAHLERKAATSALNLEKYRDLFPRVEELNAIAIEELQHFQLVLNLLKQRGNPRAGIGLAKRNAALLEQIEHELKVLEFFNGDGVEFFDAREQIAIFFEIQSAGSGLAFEMGMIHQDGWQVGQNFGQPVGRDFFSKY